MSNIFFRLYFLAIGKFALAKIRRLSLIFIVFISALALVVPAQASVIWQDFSVTYLNGRHYRIDAPHQQVLTFEHTASTNWGDSFFFLDHLRSKDGSTNYAEWSPRLSLSKLTPYQPQWGWLNDILISSTVEMSSMHTHVLYGVGVDFNLPGFRFFQLNGYRRANDKMQDNWQLTSVWAIPFQLAHYEFLYDGFIDWSSANSEQGASFNMTSQLKWNLAPLFAWQSPVYVGVEYVYWQNKYGLIDTAWFRTNESNLNFLLKAHF